MFGASRIDEEMKIEDDRHVQGYRQANVEYDDIDNV